MGLKKKWNSRNAGTGSVSFAAVGDITFGRGVGRMMAVYGFDYPYRRVKPVLKQADLVLANLETPITDRGRRVKKKINFRGDPAALPALKDAGISLVTVANNHTLDYDREGLSDTLSHLKRIGVLYTGGGEDATAAHEPLVVTRNGLRIGFLSYTTFPAYGVAKNPDTAGVAYGVSPEVIRADIEKAREQSDLVIVSFHWGYEFAPEPHSLQRSLGRHAIRAGADLVLGHHPHVLQPVERYQGKLIVYSLGNFVFDQTAPAKRKSAIFVCRLTPDGIRDAAFLPVLIVRCQPRLIQSAGVKRTERIPGEWGREEASRNRGIVIKEKESNGDHLSEQDASFNMVLKQPDNE